MKHTCKRLTALILALAMCFSLLAPAWAADVEAEEEVTAEAATEAVEETEEPVEEETAAAEEAAVAGEAEAEVAAEEAEGDAVVSAQATTSGTCGDNLTWTYSSGTLTISGTGGMYDYGDTSWPEWENYYTTITEVVVEDGVTSIGAYAFGFSEKGTYFSLETVRLPASVTSIGEGAFAWDDAYLDPFIVYYDGTMQDWANIDINYDGKLNGLRFADINCSDGTILGEDPSNYYDEDEDETSGECGDNVYWELDTGTGVLTIFGTGEIGDYAFFSLLDEYDNITVVIEDGVTSIGWNAFYGCENLTCVTIPDSVTSIEDGAFDGCTGLTSVTIGNGVTSIGDNAFSDCTSLTNVTIPDSVTSIGAYAFYGCESLTSVTIPNGVTSIGSYAFYGCTSLTSVTIPDSVTSIRSSAFEGCTSLTSVTIPDSVTSIGSYAFYGCTSLTSVTIPDSVTSIGSGAFGGCTSLTSVTIPDGVTSISSTAFEGCTSLTSVTIPDSVTSIRSSAFEGCTSLTSVTIPDSVTSIGSYAFYGCTSLTSVTIGSGVTSIGSSAFAYCTSLTDVYYCGSEDDWAAISISSSGNTYLTNATIHYNYDPSAVADLSTCTVTLSTTSYTYDGKAKTPTVTVKDASGNALTQDTDYTVKYTNNTNYGTGTVTVTGIGNYTGTATAAFTIVPAAPTLSSVSNTTSGVKITWKAVSGVTGYRVYRKAAGDSSWTNIKSSTTSTSYTDTTAKSGTTYYYTVRAYSKADGTNYWGSYDKTGLSIKYLTAGKISSLTNTSSGITVKWSKVTGASGYYVYRKTSSGSYSRIATVTSGSTVSYSDTAVKSKNGTTYVYAVRPYSGSTLGSYTGKTTVRLTGVSISSLKNSSSKKMTVKWGKNSKATGYQIQYSTSSSFSSYKTVTVSSYKTVSKTISSLTKGKKYYVRVRAYKTVSGTKYYSAWSSTKNVKISK